jgi:peptidoglycan/LPS O-acetylase OafA/YrhL
MNNNIELLQTKQHFKVLDGLRGIAALVVVIFHFVEIILLPEVNPIAHGFLAVDFFFCLSGFVIAYAYDQRAEGLGFWNFIKLRLIRLQPLVIVGSILGLLTFLFDPFSNLYAVYGFGKTVLLFLSSVFLIPYPIVNERFNNLFNLNAPAWSLFWEYVANVGYILLLVKVKKNLLLFLVVIAGFILLYVAYSHSNLLGGWSGPTFWDGGARILYSFLAGMLVYRANWIIKNKLGFAGLALGLVAVFFVPFHASYNWIVEPILVIIVFPLIVSLGAGTAVSVRAERFAMFSGDMSYPLYMVHYPFMWVFATYMTAVKPSATILTWVVPVAVTSLVVFAYLVMKFIDMPMRKYLRGKLFKN